MELEGVPNVVGQRVCPQSHAENAKEQDSVLDVMVRVANSIRVMR